MKHIHILILILFSSAFYCNTHTISHPSVSAGTVHHLSSEDELKNFLQHGTVILYFYADWCGPCRQMKNVYESVAREFPQFVFIKIDVVKFDALSNAMHIMSLPSFIVYKDGVKKASYIGYLSKSQFTAKLIALDSGREEVLAP